MPVPWRSGTIADVAARARRSAGGRARAGRAAGSRRGGGRRTRRPRLRRGRCPPAPPRRGRASSGSGTTSAPASAASSWATGSPLTTIVRSIVRAAADRLEHVGEHRRDQLPAPLARRCPAASRCLAAPKRLTGRTAVAFNLRGERSGVVEHDARQPGAAGGALHQRRRGQGRDLGRRRVGVALVDDHRVDQPGVERGDAGRGRGPADRLP